MNARSAARSQLINHIPSMVHPRYVKSAVRGSETVRCWIGWVVIVVMGASAVHGDDHVSGATSQPTVPPGPLAPTTQQQHEFMGMNSFMFVTIVCGSLFFEKLIFHLKLPYLPATSGTMIVGLVVGGFATLFGEMEAKLIAFDESTFFFFLLPPIIFDAGYSLKRKQFFRNFVTINLFAVLGTLVSTFVIGFSLYGMAKLSMIPLDHSNPMECLTFASLISAVDPVATLAILGSEYVNADPLLYSLVFGESVLNDAVSITLFRTFNEFTRRKTASVDGYNALSIVGSFIGISIGSIAIGVAVALFCAYVLRRSSFRNSPAHEYCIMFLFAYLAYSISEILKLSGVMALFFCGIVMSHYAWYNISTIAQQSTSQVFKSFALLCETSVFVYLGFMAGVSGLSVFQLKWSIVLIFATTFLCAISRAAFVFPFSMLANLRRKRKIPFNMQVVIWFAGLRGAVAFALALNIDSAGRPYVITTTLVVVFFTTVVCGGLTETIVSRMGLRNTRNVPSGSTGDPLVQRRDFDGEVDDDDDDDDDENDEGHRGLVYDSSSFAMSGMHRLWRDFDDQYMREWFGGPSLGRRLSLQVIHRGYGVESLDMADLHSPHASIEPLDAEGGL